MEKRHGSIDPLHGLKEVHLDFEKQLFTVNGVDIGKCTDVDIMFHNGEWKNVHRISRKDGCIRVPVY